MTNLQILPALYFNVKAYGAKGNGSTDDTSAIAAARSAARSAGSGVIFYPPGIYISGNQDISNDANIYHIGSGKNATIIMLKNGANADLFSGQTSLISIGSGSTVAGSLYAFGFANLTLDGNRANQTGGPSYPLRFYGYSYILENIDVRNGYSGNVLSNWRDPGTNAMQDSTEARWSGVKVHGSGGIGVQIDGPHDSQFSDCVFFEEDSHTFHIAPNAVGIQCTNIHCWNPGSTYQNAHRFGGNFVTYAYDNFVRANQSGLGTAQDGETWANLSGSSGSISSNQGYFTSSENNQLGTKTAADVDIVIHGGLSDYFNNANGIVARIQSATSFYSAYYYNGTLYLDKEVGGSITNLASHGVDILTTPFSIRFRAIGTQLQVKLWTDLQYEPTGWAITITDSTFSSGTYGITSGVGAGYAYIDSFVVNQPYIASGAVGILCEANVALFSNCVTESSDTAQLVLLGNGDIWEGSVFDVTPQVESVGIQVGQAEAQVAYSGQVYQSGGLATGYNTNHCHIRSRIAGCHSPLGALWLDFDGGNSVFEIDAWGGVPFNGSFTSEKLEINYDGDRGSGGLCLQNAPLALELASTLYSGSGIPSPGIGSNGDFYFRKDTPGTANQRLYVKASDSWTGVV